MNEPRVVKSVTNECQSLGRAHESSSARAEQLIACLEGEIAKRDAELAACRVAVENCEVFLVRIAELEADRDSHQRCAIQAMAELASIKAQEPIGWYTEDHLDDKSATTYSWTVAERWVEKGWPVSPLYAAPVSEAEAQGVVQWPDADEIMQMAFEEGQPADDASGYCFELEEFDLFIERLMSEVASLNAAPVQQASVPDELDRAFITGESCDGVYRVVIQSEKLKEMQAVHRWLASLKAAPAADAGHVFYGMDGNHP